jgi:hypothetical protein
MDESGQVIGVAILQSVAATTRRVLTPAGNLSTGTAAATGDRFCIVTSGEL